MAASCRPKHVNSSWADTVRCLLDAGKRPMFRSQSLCTYIYVQESQRFWDFVRIYTYESRKGLKEEDVLDRTKWKNDMHNHSGDARWWETPEEKKKKKE